jgi:hypothetical protein
MLMDEQSAPRIQKVSFERISTWAFFLVIITVVIITFLKYFYLKDYYIQAQADCDPETEKCFSTTCDSATDDTCSQNPDEQTSYYKIIKKKAYLIPLCDLNSKDCPKLACSQDEDCEETLCDETTVKDQEGAECNDPEAYKKNMKSEEDIDSESDQACDPADTECNPDTGSNDNSDQSDGAAVAPAE